MNGDMSLFHVEPAASFSDTTIHLASAHEELVTFASQLSVESVEMVFLDNSRTRLDIEIPGQENLILPFEAQLLGEAIPVSLHSLGVISIDADDNQTIHNGMRGGADRVGVKPNLKQKMVERLSRNTERLKVMLRIKPAPAVLLAQSARLSSGAGPSRPASSGARNPISRSASIASSGGAASRASSGGATSRASSGGAISASSSRISKKTMIPSLSGQSSRQLDVNMQALDHEATFEEAVDFFSTLPKGKLPGILVQRLPGMSQTEKITLIQNGLELRNSIVEEMPRATSYTKRGIKKLQSESGMVRKFIEEKNIDGLKSYLKTLPTTLQFNGEVSFIGIMGPYDQLKALLTLIKKEKGEVGDVSSDDIIVDHNYNNGQTEVLLQTRDNGSAMVLSALANRYKDLSFRTQRKENYIHYLNDTDRSTFIKFREQNLITRLRNDAFVWTLLLEFDLANSKKIMDAIHKTCILEGNAIITPWLTAFGLDKNPELSVPTYELLKGIHRVENTFNKIESLQHNIANEEMTFLQLYYLKKVKFCLKLIFYVLLI